MQREIQNCYSKILQIKFDSIFRHSVPLRIWPYRYLCFTCLKSHVNLCKARHLEAKFFKKQKLLWGTDSQQGGLASSESPCSPGLIMSTAIHEEWNGMKWNRIFQLEGTYTDYIVQLQVEEKKWKQEPRRKEVARGKTKVEDSSKPHSLQPLTVQILFFCVKLLPLLPSQLEVALNLFTWLNSVQSVCLSWNSEMECSGILTYSQSCSPEKLKVLTKKRG